MVDCCFPAAVLPVGAICREVGKAEPPCEPQRASEGRVPALRHCGRPCAPVPGRLHLSSIGLVGLCGGCCFPGCLLLCGVMSLVLIVGPALRPDSLPGFAGPIYNNTMAFFTTSKNAKCRAKNRSSAKNMRTPQGYVCGVRQNSQGHIIILRKSKAKPKPERTRTDFALGL